MNRENLISSVIGGLGLVVAIIALVPSFLSLGRHEPLLYYTSQVRQVALPDGLDTQSVLSLFKQNNIPSGSVTVELVNKGEGPAKRVNIRLALPVHVTQVKLTPSRDDKPAWVEIANYELGTSDSEALFTQSFADLATGKRMKLDIWFQYLPSKVEEQEKELEGLQPEVYVDGVEAKEVADLAAAHQVTWVDHFTVPFQILIASIAAMFVIAFIVRTVRDPNFREVFWNSMFWSTIMEMPFALGISIQALGEVLEFFGLRKRTNDQRQEDAQQPPERDK